MTRIDDVIQCLNHALVVLARTKDVTIDAYEGLERDLAYALDDDGHLLPDLPEPDANDGIWYLHRDVIVHNGVGPCACIEDDHHIHVFKPEEGRAVAYALLAAADYAEEHTNDQ